MKDWEYNFDPVSKEDWFNQIEADLRQKPVSSLQSEWWPGEPLTPLIHAEDLSDEPVRLPDPYFNQPPLITECVHTEGIASSGVNERILEALRYGAQSIVIQHSQAEAFSPEVWFKDVMKEMVALAVEPDVASADGINNLSANHPDRLLIRIRRNGTAMPLNLLLHTLIPSPHAIDNIRLVYHIPSSGIWDSSTANTFNALLDDYNTWSIAGLSHNAFFNQCILSLDADPFYFKHIIQSRVIHLLWHNLKETLGIDMSKGSENPLECHIEQTENEKPDHYLIRASMSSLAASLSGTHALCIHHTEAREIQPFYRRINRNIHHLLNLESAMFKGRDPLAGAFALDYHCRSWTKNIWDMLALGK